MALCPTCRTVIPCHCHLKPPAGQTALRQQLIAAIKTSPFKELRTVDYANGPLQITVNVDDLADAVLAVLPEPADRAAVLRWAAEELDARMERFFSEWPDEPRNSPYALGQKDAAAELRRLADETATTHQPRPASTTWTFEACYDASNDKWHGIGPTHQDHDAAVDEFQQRINRHPERHIRMVRATTTYTVDAEHEPATARQDGATP